MGSASQNLSPALGAHPIAPSTGLGCLQVSCEQCPPDSHPEHGAEGLPRQGAGLELAPYGALQQYDPQGPTQRDPAGKAPGKRREDETMKDWTGRERRQGWRKNRGNPVVRLLKAVCIDIRQRTESSAELGKALSNHTWHTRTGTALPSTSGPPSRPIPLSTDPLPLSLTRCTQKSQSRQSGSRS